MYNMLGILKENLHTQVGIGGIIVCKDHLFENPQITLDSKGQKIYKYIVSQMNMKMAVK